MRLSDIRTFLLLTVLISLCLFVKQMWREESGFLEMFLAYYSQFEENVTEQKPYRDFLFDVLCLHERCVR